jgi:hypothetical protein
MVGMGGRAGLVCKGGFWESKYFNYNHIFTGIFGLPFFGG